MSEQCKQYSNTVTDQEKNRSHYDLTIDRFGLLSYIDVTVIADSPSCGRSLV